MTRILMGTGQVRRIAYFFRRGKHKPYSPYLMLLLNTRWAGWPRSKRNPGPSLQTYSCAHVAAAALPDAALHAQLQGGVDLASSSKPSSIRPATVNLIMIGSAAETVAILGGIKAQLLDVVGQQKPFGRSMVGPVPRPRPMVIEQFVVCRNSRAWRGRADAAEPGPRGEWQPWPGGWCDPGITYS